MPITQYFECARQAGLVRYSSSSGETDPCVRVDRDLYSLDFQKPVRNSTLKKVYFLFSLLFILILFSEFLCSNFSNHGLLYLELRFFMHFWFGVSLIKQGKLMFGGLVEFPSCHSSHSLVITTYQRCDFSGEAKVATFKFVHFFPRNYLCAMLSTVAHKCLLS